MGLYFETRNHKSWLKKVLQRLSSNDITTPKDVESAKKEVLQESLILAGTTETNERIVQYVTENRITHFAMGVPSEISKIQHEDVVNLWEEFKKTNSIHVFQFRNAKEIKALTKLAITQNTVQKNYRYILNQVDSGPLLLTHENTCRLEISLL